MSDYRAESRQRWARTAQGWERRAAMLRKATAPVSAWMVEALGPQPGDRILELGTGPGDTGFMAAELIEPGGELIASDLVPEMLSAAQRRAEALGLRNVRFRQIDAEGIDLPAASLDGVLFRWGYMLLADQQAGLRETRRVLKPGGRVALAAWTGRDENPWSAVPVRELAARGLTEEDDPDAPGQFAWAGDGVLASRLEEAGFVEFEIDTVGFAFEYESLEDWWGALQDLSLRIGEAGAAMDAATRAELLDALREHAREWTREDGSLRIPARTWVAAATG